MYSAEHLEPPLDAPSGLRPSWAPGTRYIRTWITCGCGLPSCDNYELSFIFAEHVCVLIAMVASAGWSNEGPKASLGVWASGELNKNYYTYTCHYLRL